MPWVLLGNFIARYREKIIALFSGRLCLILALASVLLCVAERIIYTHYMNLGSVGRTVFTSPYVFFVFVFAIKNPELYLLRPMAFIGRKLSLFIYIMHSMISQILGTLFSHFAAGFHESLAYQWISPIIFALVTIMAGFIFIKVCGFVKNRRVGSN